MGPDGRVSTPKWFKELGFIVRTHGTADAATNDVRTAMDYLGVPVMAHWYQWHQIPFDNDYPHYFPAKPGFEEDEPSAQALAARLRAVGCTAWVTTVLCDATGLRPPPVF